MSKILALLFFCALLCVVACEPKYEPQKGSFTDTRDGKVYKTVEIGEQIWMAENLNYKRNGSECNGKEANCDKYGRLYDWKTAMKACPKGWHLPSKEEWDVLYRYVDSNYTSSPSESETESEYFRVTGETAGKYLKAKSGWDCFNGKSGNGTDKYGFSALPGGTGSIEPGEIGAWWSSSEENLWDAYTRYIPCNYDFKPRVGNNRYGSALRSVRCVLGKTPAPAQQKGTLTDKRDRKTFPSSPGVLMLHINEQELGSAYCLECHFFKKPVCMPPTNARMDGARYECEAGKTIRKKIVLKKARIELEKVIRNLDEYVPENLRVREMLKSKKIGDFLKDFNKMPLVIGHGFSHPCYNINIYDDETLIATFETNGHNFYDRKNKLMYRVDKKGEVYDPEKHDFLRKYWEVYAENQCR